MSSESVRRMRRATVLCTILLSLATGVVVANKPDTANGNGAAGKRKYWVSRRHVSEPDKKNNIAIAMRVEYDTPQQGDITVRIWRYTTVDIVNDRYVPSGNVIVCDATVVGNVSTNRKLEKLELTDRQSKEVYGWTTRWLGTSKARGHTRVLFRYSKDFPVSVLAPKQAPNEQKQSVKTPTLIDCEEPPADDVLEEESLPPVDDPAMDPPEISYDP